VRIAVDVGSVRLGVAVSDPAGGVAVPSRSLPRAGDPLADLLAEAAERDAVEFIVGLPLTLAGVEGAAAVAARQFALELASAAVIPVRLVDERLSTVTAHERLHEAGVRGTRGRTRTRSVVDAAAAAVFLQAALDAEAATGQAPGEVVSG
jgi:putative transcription antitermination factor YqgF